MKVWLMSPTVAH